jgi:hypothetical protein
MTLHPAPAAGLAAEPGAPAERPAPPPLHAPRLNSSNAAAPVAIAVAAKDGAAFASSFISTFFSHGLVDQED